MSSAPGITASVIVKSTAGPVTEQLVPLDGTGVGRVGVPFGEATRSVVVAVGNGNGRQPALAAFSLIREGTSSVTAGVPFGPDTLIYGEGTLLTGFVRCNDQPAAHAKLILTVTDDATGEAAEVALRTDAGGMWSYSMQPPRNTSYSVRVDDPLLSSATSASKQVSVLLDVTLEASRSTVPLGESISLAGEIRPNHGQLPMAIEFRRPEQRWRLGTETSSTGSGDFRAQLTLPAPGIWEIRARPLTTDDEDHEPGASNSVVVDVQD